jgi:hypothetical protein
MGRQEPRKWTIDLLQCQDTIGKQVHRRLKKHLRADWTEPNDHKIPSPECLAELMAML